MPIHSAMSSRFPLLEGVPSIQALMEDPQYAQVRAEFESYPAHQVPDVRVRADAAPGPHGAVPVRVYNDGAGDGGRPWLVWMHGGALMIGEPETAQDHLAGGPLRHPADVGRPRRADAGSARPAEVPAGGDKLLQLQLPRRTGQHGR